jgi:hypothetical protein
MSYLPQPIDEQQDCHQDTLRRINTWLTVLEEHIVALLQGNDLQTMKPGEREQAASRHLTMLLRLLQCRWQLAQSARPAPSPAEQALLDALLQDMENS